MKILKISAKRSYEIITVKIGDFTLSVNTDRKLLTIKNTIKKEKIELFTLCFPKGEESCFLSFNREEIEVCQYFDGFQLKYKKVDLFWNNSFWINFQNKHLLIATPATKRWEATICHQKKEEN